ncbi:odorant binding protein 7 isoform X2 [Ptiloglossa arizonensis]|uniref:odorant binding protein 7 isoform X2 n=1 Tax=Ptiloglossa arizonensis TaxID=3350558 RepID=UPI003F9F168B
MKCTTIVVCVLFSSVTVRGIDLRGIANTLNVSENALDECLKDNRLEGATVDTTKMESIFRQSEENPDGFLKNFGCFVSCAFEKSKIIRNDEIQLEALLRTVKRNNISTSLHLTQRLSECIDKTKKETDKCDAVLAFVSCSVRLL